jgi:hypothetical protein
MKSMKRYLELRSSVVCAGALGFALVMLGCNIAENEPMAASEEASSAAVTTDEVNAGSAGELGSDKLARLALGDLRVARAAKGAINGRAGDIALALYPAEWFVHVRLTSPDPVTIRHPSGVNTVWVFGGTIFFPGDFVSIGKSFLTMQFDGNFVLYDENNVARWAANTFGRGAYAEFQVDGNLVVYDINGVAIGTNRVPSNTCCHSGWNLHVQEDGNVVIYAPGWSPRWSTGTFH